MNFQQFLTEAKKNKKVKVKHKSGEGLKRLLSEIEGRIDALEANWEPEEFKSEIQPNLDKAGKLSKLSTHDAVKLFLEVTRCYFNAKYPTATDQLVSKIKVAKDESVDELLVQLAKDLAAFAQKKYPGNKELDDLLTDYEFGYVDQINTESLIILNTEIIAFIS